MALDIRVAPASPLLRTAALGSSRQGNVFPSFFWLARWARCQSRLGFCRAPHWRSLKLQAGGGRVLESLGSCTAWTSYLSSLPFPASAPGLDRSVFCSFCLPASIAASPTHPGAYSGAAPRWPVMLRLLCALRCPQAGTKPLYTVDLAEGPALAVFQGGWAGGQHLAPPALLPLYNYSLSARVLCFPDQVRCACPAGAGAISASLPQLCITLGSPARTNTLRQGHCPAELLAERHTKARTLPPARRAAILPARAAARAGGGGGGG